MNITIDYDQGRFIATRAGDRINSAMAVVTPWYRKRHLADRTDDEYTELKKKIDAEMVMLRGLVAEVCAYCDYKLDGTDTDGTKWYRCKVHDELAPSKDAPCAGYVEEPYIYKTHPLEG